MINPTQNSHMKISYDASTMPNSTKPSSAPASPGLHELMRNPQGSLVVHYACSSLDQGEVPAIRCIVVRSLRSEGIQINKTFKAMGPKDPSERQMLEAFLEFALEHSNQTWIIWTENGNYGIQRIWDRLRDLGGRKVEHILPHTRVVVPLLRGLFGRDCIPPHNPRGKMLELFRLNNIGSRFFLRGPEEIESFAAGEYAQVEASTYHKASAIRELLQKADEGLFVGAVATSVEGVKVSENAENMVGSKKSWSIFITGAFVASVIAAIVAGFAVCN